MRYSALMQADELVLLDGPGGWVEARLEGDAVATSPRTWVRFVDEDGAWVAGGLYLHSPKPDDLRAAPLRRIELAVNAHKGISDAVRRRLRERTAEPGTADFFRSFTGYVKQAEPPLVLRRPKGKALNDAWYQEVADVYRAAAARGLRPRVAIADAAGVSRDVAGRWVYEARKRGFLPPTDAGKVTA